MTEIVLDVPTEEPTPIATNGAAPAPAAPASPPLAQPTVQTPTEGVAEFEGTTVAEVSIVLTGTTAVDSGDSVVSIDDVIRVVGEFQVVGVFHQVNKEGQVVRVQRVKARSDLTLVPWNPADPMDVGIIHARH